jgi:hypothetical protein
MKRFIAILILLSFAAPVRAQLPSGFEPVEKNLIEKQQLEEEMTKDFQKPQQDQPQEQVKKKGSNWWKWGLGILVVGGIAAAAGGGGGGGGGGGNGGGTVNVGW